MRQIITLLIFYTVILIAGCNENHQDIGIDTDKTQPKTELRADAVKTGQAMPVQDDSAIEQAVKGNAAFALDLYPVLRSDNANLIYSPYSLSVALAMTYAGAKGDTKKDMARVLHFSEDQKAVCRGFSLLDKGMNLQDGGVELNTANALWAQNGLTFLEDYLGIMERCYGAGLKRADFIHSSEEARLVINSWVENQTRQKIKDLIKKGIIRGDTRLVLTNAIYFKGRWEKRFRREDTRQAPFHTGAAETIDVPMMYLSSSLRVNRFDSFTAIEMPYTGGGFSMFIFLPEAKDGLKNLEDLLVQGHVSSWVDRLCRSDKKDVHVYLPRFTLTSEFRMGRTLSSMGMSSAFGGQADFSGMTGGRDLCISEVVHKAFIDVNEEGTEAAAATAVVMRKSVSRAVEFRADHPFVYLIRDNTNGCILFIGRVVTPAG